MERGRERGVMVCVCVCVYVCVCVCVCVYVCACAQHSPLNYSIKAREPAHLPLGTNETNTHTAHTHSTHIYTEHIRAELTVLQVRIWDESGQGLSH